MACNEKKKKTKCHLSKVIHNHYYCSCCGSDDGDATTQPSSEGNPIGTIIAYPAATIPSDYLECNGEAIERETYADLFEIIGETYGKGDGGNTFNLPDLRGEFIRGLDNGREVDNGRELGSWQKGTLTMYDAVAANTMTAKHLETIAAIGAIPFNFSVGQQKVGFDVINKSDYNDTGCTCQNLSDSGTAFEKTENNTIYGATRPRNVAMIYCIKAK